MRRPVRLDPPEPHGTGASPVRSPVRVRGAAPFRRPVSAVRRRAPSVVPTLPSAQVGAHPHNYSSRPLSTDTQASALTPSRDADPLVTIASVFVLPLVFTSGWASGINAYAVVLLLGVFGATGLTDEVPASLQRTDVLCVAGALFLCEAVADKIPYVDSVWDSVHTVIRPVSGAVVGALLTGQSGSLSDLAAGALGGSTALASHAVKAGTRMAINTSPEPVSNFVVSVAEDLGVGGIISFAMFYPEAAAIIAAVLLLIGLVLLFFIAHRIRRFLRRRAQRRPEKQLAARVGGPAGCLAEPAPRSDDAGRPARLSTSRRPPAVAVSGGR